MLKQKFTVGGEFIVSPSIIGNPVCRQFSDYASSLTEYHRYYTFGAYYSLKAVIEQLNFQPGEYALLPSYSCPTIIEPFRKAGVSYDFYKMKEGLIPDPEDIDRKIRPGLRAVLFIDYFGFPQKEYLAGIVGQLRSKGVNILQDTVQAWMDNENNLYGDFCFNSVRKYTPFEASVLLSRTRMNFQSTLKPIGKFILHKRYAQLLRYIHLRYGLLKPESFLKQIDIANQNYHQDAIIGIPGMNRRLLDRFDFSAEGRKRRLVYRTLESQLAPKLIIERDLGKVVPLGMAIYLEDRDAKKARLHSLDIHCPLHWKLSADIDKKEHAFSWDLEQHALTLPVNVKLPDLTEYTTRLKEVLI